jgi:hypothetical protein
MSLARQPQKWVPRASSPLSATATMTRSVAFSRQSGTSTRSAIRRNGPKAHEERLFAEHVQRIQEARMGRDPMPPENHNDMHRSVLAELLWPALPQDWASCFR